MDWVDAKIRKPKTHIFVLAVIKDKNGYEYELRAKYTGKRWVTGNLYKASLKVVRWRYIEIKK